jgi:hypothetical protein
VLLGVNSDPERELAREAVARHSLNWRSWWAGGPGGEIPQQWFVTSWPTMYLIDARGIVRHRLTAPHNLERVIEALVREAGR